MPKVKNTMQVTWVADFSTLNLIDASINKVVEEDIRETLEAAKDYIDEHWSPNSPSDPGNPPAVVTGELRESIKVDRRDNLGKFASRNNASTWSLRVEAEYGAALEFGRPEINLAPRPFLRPAMNHVKGQLGSRVRTFLQFMKPRRVYTVLNPFSAQSVYIDDEIEGLG